MKVLTFKTQREPGFRLNLRDILILAALFLLTWRFYGIVPEHGVYLLPAYLGISFFLFCNLFRIGNRLEAFWYVPFVVAVIAGSSFPDQFWLIVLTVSEPLRVALIVYRIRRGPYVGIFCRKDQTCPTEG